MNYNHRQLPASSSFGPYSNGGTSVMDYRMYSGCPTGACNCPSALPGDGMATFGAVPYSPRKVFLQHAVEKRLQGDEGALGRAMKRVEAGEGVYEGMRYGAGMRGGRRTNVNAAILACCDAAGDYNKCCNTACNKEPICTQTCASACATSNGDDPVIHFGAAPKMRYGVPRPNSRILFTGSVGYMYG